MRFATVIAVALMPLSTIAQVQQGAPNADFAPAFENQTRAPAWAETPLDVTVFAKGLRRPWGIAPLPSGQFLVTERGGALRVLSADGSVSGPISGMLDVFADGQGGLLDVAISPRFSQDRTVFWTYSKPVRGGAVTAAARGALSNEGRLTAVRDIFVQSDPNRGGRHFGSRIIPMRGGTVWITTGDRGEGDSGTMPQQLDSTVGKVIRVTADGGVPQGNRFVGQAGAEAV